ncbi:MAG: NUDIX hydrolase [archaeon]
MMLLKQPVDFNSKFDIVSCFLENKGKFILLHRVDHKSEGNTWGAPAGKVEAGEDLLSATVRELFEETGVQVRKEDLFYWGKTYVRYPKYDFVYHMYSAKMPADAKIVLNKKEHKDFAWVTPSEALKMQLMMDEDMSVKLFYKI